MLPRLQLAVGGQLLLLALAGLTLTGVLAGAPALAGLGVFGVLAVQGTAVIAEARLRRLTLAARAAAASRPLSPPLPAGPQRPARLSVRLSLPWALGPDPLRANAVAPAAPSPLDPAGPVTVTPLPEGALELSLPAVSRRVGRAALDGFLLTGPIAAGLFEASVPLPAWLRVEALPRPARDGGPRVEARGHRPTPSASDAPSRQSRGVGQALHELRDYVPGDPWKLIAWKATARRGRLAVRELESDTRLSAWLLLDVSPSMFWGDPGEAPVDAAIAHATTLAAGFAEREEPVGLILFDHAVRATVPLGLGRPHLARLQRTLAAATTLHAEDRTELTHLELVATVGRWLRAHVDLDLQLPPGAIAGRDPRRSGLDEAALLARCEEILAVLEADEPGARRGALAPLSTQADRDTLRRLTSALGLPLPLERANHPGGASRGLLAALEATVAHPSRASGRGTAAPGGSGELIIALSDLRDVDAAGTARRDLRQLAQQVRRHRRQLLILTPPEPDLGPAGSRAPGDRLTDQLLLASRRAHAARVSAIEAALSPAGATVAPLGDGNAVARAFARLRAAS